MAENAPVAKKSQDDTLLAVLATFPLIGLVMYFGMNDLSDFVRHYAKQSVGLSILVIASVVIGIIPLIGWLVSCILGIAVFVGWLLLVINAFQGTKFELPVVTDLVNQLLKK
ncbi:MAG: Chloroplast import component protein (Tic20) [candidate division WS6 bacterium OLB20]|uniref:Chloroplast import component protein (Tic20) n=1 Tax=candidate division WS6 bacterium OLB20 TaxID=1617426 RepID=A0A136LYM0_9BACT|nr:MAG: Chloroplast import component protein (Tic20) [candidate division WS6 bacterium OLB20]